MEEEQMDPILMEFLDAKGAQEKYEVLKRHETEMTESLIDGMAFSIDFVIPDGSTEERLRQLKNALATRAKYELDRSNR